MENPEYDETLQTVVEDGIAVCLSAYEKLNTDIYLLLQNLRCLVEDTRDHSEYDELNNTLYSFYSSISASRKCLLDVGKPVRNLSKWLEESVSDDDDDDDEDEDEDV